MCAASQIGGPGRCTAGGWFGIGPSGAVAIARIVSRAATSPAVRSPGVPNGYPYAACSGRSDPVPRPTTSRPPEMTSRIVVIFAASAGGR